MRKYLLSLFLAVFVLAGLSASPAPARADEVGVNVGVFYSELAPYGQWVQLAPYGWVWSPYGMPVNWRPYTNGHWVYTEEYGWMWVSDYVWGWAPFHYGRWFYDDEYGWLWVPGTVWAPAWVAWQYGDDWVGWAPLPPFAVWSPGIGFTVGVVEIERHIRPTHWIFCRERDFDRPHVDRHIEVPARNVTILQRTKNVTRYNIVEGRVVERSIDFRRVERVAGRPIERYRVRVTESPTTRGQIISRPGEIAIYRPPRLAPAPTGVRPPEARPPQVLTTPERYREQETIQRRELLQQQQAEQQRLEQHYRERLQSPPPGQSPALIRRQQQTEMRVMSEEHQRQQQLLQRRQQREFKAIPQPRQPSRGVTQQPRPQPQPQQRRFPQQQQQ